MNQVASKAKKAPAAKGRIELNVQHRRVLIRIGRITKGLPDVWVKPASDEEFRICEALRFRGLLNSNVGERNPAAGAKADMATAVYRVSPFAEDLDIFDGWRALDLSPTTTRAGIGLRSDPDGLSIRFPVDYQGAQPTTGGLEGEVRVGTDGLVSMRVRADYEGAIWYSPSEEHGEPMRIMNAAIRALAQATSKFWDEADER